MVLTNKDIGRYIVVGWTDAKPALAIYLGQHKTDPKALYLDDNRVGVFKHFSQVLAIGGPAFDPNCHEAKRLFHSVDPATRP